MTAAEADGVIVFHGVLSRITLGHPSLWNSKKSGELPKRHLTTRGCVPDSNAIIARRGAKRSRQRSRLLALMPPWLRNRVRHTFTGLWDLEIARKAAQIYRLLRLWASRQEHRGENRNRTRKSVFCTCLLIRNCACVNVCARVCLCVCMCVCVRVCVWLVLL